MFHIYPFSRRNSSFASWISEFPTFSKNPWLEITAFNLPWCLLNQCLVEHTLYAWDWYEFQKGKCNYIDEASKGNACCNVNSFRPLRSKIYNRKSIYFRNRMFSIFNLSYTIAHLNNMKQNNTWRAQSSLLFSKIGEQQVTNSILSVISILTSLFFSWKFISLLQSIIVVSTIEHKKISHK